MYYYHMVLVFAVRWSALAFSIVAGLILLLSLYDLFLGASWGMQWYTPLVALVFIAIGLGVRHVAVLAWRQMRRPEGS